MSEHVHDVPVAQAASARLMRLASLASLGTALSLIGVKLWAWYATESVSILSSAADSLLDLVASLITLVAVGVALQPADRDHRFGHGKSEGLASMAQAVIVGGSALYVGYEGVARLRSPQVLEGTTAGIVVMLVSLALTLALLAFQRHVVRRTGSMAITADSVHYKSDLLSNVAVLSALVLSGLLGWVYADPVVALGVAAYIGWSALSIGRDAVDVLMDRELPEEDRKRLTALAAGHAAVLGVHDLRTRSAGSTRFVQLHIELNPGLSLAAAHSVADEVEAAIRTEFPDADVIIHTDPHGLEPRSGR